MNEYEFNYEMASVMRTVWLSYWFNDGDIKKVQTTCKKLRKKVTHASIRKLLMTWIKLKDPIPQINAMFLHALDMEALEYYV
ncbi:hypothetical protein KNT80_gp66 [Vibrio phage 1.245.O._10N.261.54.C7]|uniref:Uncharacterized protein n=1 Tax=Vibrio phage 1.245.O._10N.261.54.C7 TaxID=1881236 RepID=A0A2I7RWF0_9CAUD|nr:hypothetical protein KNT80_gp66 [Vibrio phage 1.245.O._10N.261.54.C7]AUR97979.1 hypothetical protein NVP1245O_66 [Vibrio phage 1.245.O._10N.261.54.C7]